MKCNNCGSMDSKVIDSRQSEDGYSIRRRRECNNCGKRFTTYETIEVTPVLVIKNNGVIQPFDIIKVRNGIIKACEKRPVTPAQIDKVVSAVNKQVMGSLNQEITSKEIGEYVMDQLRALDEVAYVRFASIHRKFKDISTFMSEIETLLNKKH